MVVTRDMILRTLSYLETNGSEKDCQNRYIVAHLLLTSMHLLGDFHTDQFLNNIAREVCCLLILFRHLYLSGTWLGVDLTADTKKTMFEELRLCAHGFLLLTIEPNIILGSIVDIIKEANQSLYDSSIFGDDSNMENQHYISRS
jgi:hypothetical protein